MPAKVTLKVVKGELAGTEFAFDERTTCIVGRAKECMPKIPSDEFHRSISRHHCLLDINPPDIRVRDFGSLNGTRVNGKLIGKRGQGQTREDGAKIKFPEFDLKDGDQLKLAKTIFEVTISEPKVCSQCSAELTDEEQRQSGADKSPVVCAACVKKAKAAGRPVTPARKKAKTCAACGRDVAAEIGSREGAYICTACQADPWRALKHLLGLAKSGEKELVAIKDYEILKELGRGGMGAVFLARHERTQEQVALKVMLPKVAAQERARKQFLRETVNTAALKHRNIVELRDSGCSEGTFYFTLEYCDGGSVDMLMAKRGGRLKISEALPIVRQCLDGLAYAHEASVPHVELADGMIAGAKGIVHRDLSPHNLFLARSSGTFVTKVGDFGLSKAFDKAGLSGYATRTNMAAGKPAFMPRQQVVNYKYSKPEVDVWAMAACLYCMLTGYVPRDFPEHKDPWQVVLWTSAVPIRKRDSSIPSKLAEVIDHALIDKPNIPVKTAGEFQKMLEGAL